MLALGLVLVRRQRKRAGIDRSEYKAWDIAIFFSLLANTYLLVAPWYPPSGGATGGDVSFWYATYCVAGIAM